MPAIFKLVGSTLIMPPEAQGVRLRLASTVVIQGGGGSGGGEGTFKVDDLMLNTIKRPWVIDDLIAGGPFGDAASMASGPLNGGTASIPANASGHYGILRFNSHAANSNSGYAYATNMSLLLTDVRCRHVAIFRKLISGTNLACRLGFDSSTGTSEDQGVYAAISGSTMTCRIRIGTTNYDATSAITLTDNTWYALIIVVDPTNKNATFTLKNDSNAVVASQVVATSGGAWFSSSNNFPVRAVAFAPTGPGTATGLIDLDLIGAWALDDLRSLTF